MKNKSNITKTKDGHIEKSSGRRIVSPLDKLNESEHELVKAKLGTPRYLVIVKDSVTGQEYKIHESMELEGFGEHCRVVCDAYTPKLFTLIGCLKYIAKVNPDMLKNPLKEPLDISKIGN